ncbi:hypothetical protein ACFL6M_01350 [Candidatus Eisenbacteria bacterium]|uniref:HprK-related kinase B n=1 Tax=Eiseniibacteriota bacterium TaxID=2212470 RepID=A0ABV6YIV9_UNCEI
MTDYLRELELSAGELQSVRDRAASFDAYRFFDLDVTIHSDSDTVLQFFRQNYRHFRVPPQEDRGDAHAYYVLVDSGRPEGALLHWDEHRVCSLLEGHALADSADVVIFGSLQRKNDTYFLIHAGAVACRAGAVILAGMSGSGKTTLTLELTRRGLLFCSDELAAISRSTHLLHPFPRAIGARDGTRSLLDGVDFESGKVHHTAGNEVKRIVDISDISNAPLAGVCPGKYLILLETGIPGAGVFRPDSHEVRVGLRHLDRDLIERLSDIDGVARLSVEAGGKRPFASFRIQKRKSVQDSFLDICRAHDEAILYRVKVMTSPPDPSREPQLTPMTKMQAGLALLGNLQNVVANDGWMQKKSAVSITETLFELLGVISKMDCYRLVVGNLKRTADLILDLVGS